MSKERICWIAAVFILILTIFILICKWDFSLIDNKYVTKFFYILFTFLTTTIAVLQYQNNKKLAQNLSFEYMERYTQAPINNIRKIVTTKFKYKMEELKDKKIELKHYFDIESEEYKNNPETQRLRFCAMELCNFFEEMAIAIEQKMVDEKILKAFFKSIIRLHYQNLCEFIDLSRSKNSTTFEYFIKLNHKWNN
jgi:hypothetical protein